MKNNYIIKGFLFLMLSFIGLLIPVIPQVPFFLAAMAYFSKGNKKLHNWLTKRKAYKLLEKIMNKDMNGYNTKYIVVK